LTIKLTPHTLAQEVIFSGSLIFATNPFYKVSGELVLLPVRYSVVKEQEGYSYSLRLKLLNKTGVTSAEG